MTVNSKYLLRLLLAAIIVCPITLLNAPAQNFVMPAVAAQWKLFSTGEKEFRFLMPESARIEPSTETSVLSVIKPGGEEIRSILCVTAFENNAVYLVTRYGAKNPLRLMNDLVEANYYREVPFRDYRFGKLSGKKQIILTDDKYILTRLIASKEFVYEIKVGARTFNTPNLKQFNDSISIEDQTQPYQVETDLPVVNRTEAANSSAEPSGNITFLRGKHRAEVLYRPEPSYTNGARREAKQGTVVLRCALMSSGEVGAIKLVTSLDNGLDQNAIDAARRLRFIPAVIDGKTVSQWIQVEYNFNLY